MRRFLLTVAAVGWLLLVIVAAAPAQTPDAKKSLDAELLEQLDNDLLNELDALPLPDPADAGAIDGEDIGQPGEDAEPTRRIVWRMEQVRAKLADDNAGLETQRQQQLIVDELSALIESFQSRPKSGQGKQDAASPATSQRERPDSPSRRTEGQPDGKPSTEPGSRPSLDSSDEIRPDEVAGADAEAVRRSMKQAWGNLPARWRERMLQTTIEDFLPKYQREIEQYFKQLADLPPTQPASPPPRNRR